MSLLLKWLSLMLLCLALFSHESMAYKQKSSARLLHSKSQEVASLKDQLRTHSKRERKRIWDNLSEELKEINPSITKAELKALTKASVSDLKKIGPCSSIPSHFQIVLNSEEGTLSGSVFGRATVGTVDGSGIYAKDWGPAEFDGEYNKKEGTMESKFVHKNVFHIDHSGKIDKDNNYSSVIRNTNSITGETLTCTSQGRVDGKFIYGFTTCVDFCRK